MRSSHQLISQASGSNFPSARSVRIIVLDLSSSSDPCGPVVLSLPSSAGHISMIFSFLNFFDSGRSYLAVIGSKKQRKKFVYSKIYHVLKNYRTTFARSSRRKTTVYLLNCIIIWLCKHGKEGGWRQLTSRTLKVHGI
jgi:hypothetical protein